MKILLCSDGTPSSDNATRVTQVLIGHCQTAITLLGVAEQPADEGPLRAALEKEADLLRSDTTSVELVVKAGEPIQQIVDLTAADRFDLSVIGTRGRGPSGLYLRSNRTYEAIKVVHSPVLVVVGECEELKRFLVCTGGKHFIDDAVQLTGELAACCGASVTLLHVMAEPPAIYADLVRMEENLEQLITSGSELGETLRAQQEMLTKLGVPVEIRVRHGIVIDEVSKEVREGRHDLIVTGSSQTTGPIRHYIMGNLTRTILNRANCPVLIGRTGEAQRTAGLFRALEALFRSN